MANVVYKDMKSGSAVLALDQEELKSDSEVAKVVFTKDVAASATELDFLRNSQRESEVEYVSAERSNTVIQANLDNATVEVLVSSRQGEYNPVRTVTVTEIVLPDSWSDREHIPKWDRLCWEQQRAAYRNSAWWNDIFSLGLETPSPGWFEGEFSFPIEGFPGTGYLNPGGFNLGMGTGILSLLNDTESLYAPPTEVFPLRVSGEEWRKIDAEVSNISIEGAQVVYRKFRERNLGGTYQDGGSSLPTYWENWLELDDQDDPALWVFEGTFDFSSWPIIDEKQVPLIPNLNYNHQVETIQIENKVTQRPLFIPYWSGNTIYLYYFDKIHSDTKRIRILQDDQVIISQDFTYSAEGTIELGVYDTDREVEFLIQFWHEDSRGAYSWIEQHVVKTRRPMCASTEVQLVNVDFVSALVSQDGGGAYFSLTFENTGVQKLYKPSSIESAFVVDMTNGPNGRSDYLKALIERHLVARIVVSKRSKGVEVPLGSFIINPIGSGSETQGDGLNVQNVYNERGVLGYFTEDNEGQNYTIRFYPNRGDLRFNQPISTDASETYEFRIAEWTLACEHGLRTGENFAYMTEVDEDGNNYRYDSWDEEHPVRRWRRMSPVDPQFDSEERLAELSKCRACNLKDTSVVGGYGNPSTSYQITPFTVLEQAGWKCVYAECALDDLFGTWHSYDFKFKLGLRDSHATKIEVFAEYFYPRRVYPSTSQRPKREVVDLLNNREEQEESEASAEPLGAVAPAGNYDFSFSLEWTDIGNTSGVAIDPETGLPVGSYDGFDIDGDGVPEKPVKTDPVKTFICSWTHSTDVLHVVDFVSYQKIFFLVWNWLNEIYNLSNLITQTQEEQEQEENTSSSGPGDPGMLYNNNYGQPSDAPLPADEFYLTEENAFQYEQECLEVTKFINEWMQKWVRIRYTARVHYADGSFKDIVMTADPSWDGDIVTPFYGQEMNFELPTEVENNYTYVHPGISTAASQLREYWVNKPGNEGNEPESDGGLRPAGKTKSIDWSAVDPLSVDMAEKEDPMG